MMRVLRFALGLALGSACAISIQACCGEGTLFPVRTAEYSLLDPSPQWEFPPLEGATLLVEEETVTLDYVNTGGEAGSVVWEIVGDGRP